MYSQHPADLSLSEKKRAHLEDQVVAEDGFAPAGDTVDFSGVDTSLKAHRKFKRANKKKVKQVKKAQKKAARKRRGPGPIRRLLNSWWDRLLGAATSGGFAEQEEEYASHRTGRDYIWNTVGYTVWGFVFPLLTIVVTQLTGVDRAGMFSLAFVTANLLFIVGNYGVRTYQVSDVNGLHSFKDYQLNRILTVIVMLIAGGIYTTIRGYDGEMMGMCAGIFAFKAVDALADVYEGRLQQVDKLYLGGISQTIRSGAAFVIFSIVLLITGSLTAASYGMAIVALITFILVTFPLALLETPKSGPLSMASVGRLFKHCLPLFIALFMYALVDNMPKFLMDGVLSYDNQLYFNALYFPAQAILLTAGFVYKPLLVRMANAWADVEHRNRFDLFIIAMALIIVAITVVMVVIMGIIGIPVMGVLYGIDFSQYSTLCYIMLAAGGVTAGIDFLYQVITILRRQKIVTELYVITFVFSLIILSLMIRVTGLEGAVVGYLVIMLILFVLLAREYISVRIDLHRHPEHDVVVPVEAVGAEDDAADADDAPESVVEGVPVNEEGEPAPAPAPRALSPEEVRAARRRRPQKSVDDLVRPQAAVDEESDPQAVERGADDARKRLAARREGADYSESREDARNRLRKRLGGDHARK